jgi:dipeptidyl aminopeptidase/acylaminoacyl peptidase
LGEYPRKRTKNKRGLYTVKSKKETTGTRKTQSKPKASSGILSDLSKIDNGVSWAAQRETIVTELRSLLGSIPERREQLQMKVVDEIDRGTYTMRRVNYFVASDDRVSSWLLLPEMREDKEELPAILCCHSETPVGKEEPVGNGGDPNLAFAQHYAELGYITLAPDCITAGERRSVKLPAYDSRQFYKDYPDLSVAGKMLIDHQYALDALLDTPGVDATRIGVIGHGLGGFNALLLTAFDTRIQVCVASDCFTRFKTDKEPDRWYREPLVLLPGLRKYVEAGEFPFDWEHILALAAPTPVLVLASKFQSPFSNPQSVQKAVSLAKPVYTLLGADGALAVEMHHDGHTVSPEILEFVDEWFDRWL